MPSEEAGVTGVAEVLEALAPRIALFQFEVAAVTERARKLFALGTDEDSAGADLGEFALGRIDAGRFQVYSARGGSLDSTGRALIQKALESLEILSSGGKKSFVVDVQPGTSPGGAARKRLGELGVIFAISRLIERVGRGAYDPLQLPEPLHSYPFERWTAAERGLAPPLVVRVDAADLDVFELAPLLDGGIRIVLLVSGACAPAPLARLISPGVFVAQVDDAKILSRLEDFGGPAVIALMHGAEARFVHDPRAGSAVWQRIQVQRFPESQPRKSLGARSVWQQRDDLSHLRNLSEQPSFPANSADALVAAIGGASTDPAARLTSWLLEESGSPPDKT